MAGKKPPPPRVFKTKWFTKAAKKAGIPDSELCEAIEEVMKGQCDPLGGEIYKKRLNKNMHRSIVLAKGEQNWFYTFLFAKKDRENIDEDELVAFKKLAKLYGAKKDADISKEIEAKELTEICSGSKTQV